MKKIDEMKNWRIFKDGKPHFEKKKLSSKSMMLEVLSIKPRVKYVERSTLRLEALQTELGWKKEWEEELLLKRRNKSFQNG